MMMHKRWYLQAHPIGPGTLGHGLAEVWNRRAEQERFWTRRGAARAADFYARAMSLPVQFDVRREMSR